MEVELNAVTFGELLELLEEHGLILKLASDPEDPSTLRMRAEVSEKVIRRRDAKQAARDASTKG